MGLFKFRTEKSSCDAPPVEAKPKQRVVDYSALTDKVEALWNELSAINRNLRDLIDQRNELQAQIDDLETLVTDLGQSLPVSAYN